MVKETYIVRNREINLSISAGEINSVIKKSITQSACRAYDNGCIGVAGKLGEADEDLMAQAVRNLKLQIPYEPEATSDMVRQEDWQSRLLNNRSSSGEAFTVENNSGFLKEAEEVLDILKKEYPQFIFSNKIRLSEISKQLRNDAGTDLRFSDRLMSFELLVKHAESVSVFDDTLVYVSRKPDRETFLKEARERLDAFLNPLPLPEENMLPMIVMPSAFGEFLFQNLDALAMGRGTSFFNGKLGQKLFDEKFSFYVDRGPEAFGTAFFDAEGSTCKNDRCYLIQNGVLVRPFADKKLGKEFGFENTATAGGAYDSVPSNTDICFSMESSSQTLKELMGEKDGIYISVMSGGDFTSEGNFASPVQTAYLYRGGKLVGKLPEFNVSGNIYDIFGKNFAGVSSDRAYEGDFKMVVKMKIQ